MLSALFEKVKEGKIFKNTIHATVHMEKNIGPFQGGSCDALVAVQSVGGPHQGNSPLKLIAESTKEIWHCFESSRFVVSVDLPIRQQK